jgi:hypothetical protein
MMDGKQLRALFKQFNVKYWGGKLPPYSIRVVARISSNDPMGRCEKKARLIKLLRGQSDEEAISTLLHEMAHAAVPLIGDHAMSWRSEMIRLREAGAPLAGSDLDILLDDPWGDLDREYFRRWVDYTLLELFAEHPRLTLKVKLSAAIKHFVREEGGVSTPAEFQRKYSWARTIFETAKRRLVRDAKDYADARAEVAKTRAELSATRQRSNTPEAPLSP